MARFSRLAALLTVILLVPCCARGADEPGPASLGLVAHVQAEAHDSAMVEAGPGHRIAFVSDRDGALAVYSMDPDGGDQRQLTAALEEAHGVAVSPDGSRIAFTARHGGEGGTDYEVLVMNADGTGGRNLTTSGNAWEMAPCWSPDGESIAFMSASKANAGIVAVGFDGTDLRQLSDGLRWDMQPLWSPDGSRIAFASLSGRRSEIWVVQADGSDLRRLTDLGARSEWPRWSPDGKQIAFVSDWDMVTAIYTMYADGSGLRKLTESRSVDTEPCWSPDGTRIAFSSDRDGGFAIYVADAHLGREWRLTDEALGWQMQPSWSPDGAEIAFAAGLDGEWDVYVVGADGSGLRRLTSAPGYDLRPLWMGR
ncbi:MAG: hypothetical protein HPY83_05220 [Anaerolineae bacterium]|nr:hypothetical protein [Anaerolineae bacterium]